jgi:hypothetical protein
MMLAFSHSYRSHDDYITLRRIVIAIVIVDRLSVRVLFLFVFSQFFSSIDHHATLGATSSGVSPFVRHLFEIIFMRSDASFVGYTNHFVLSRSSGPFIAETATYHYRS